MENLDSNEKSDHEIISTEMLEYICDRSKTHPNINKRETRCKIHDRIKQKSTGMERSVKATQSMGKGLHKKISTVLKEILQELTALG